VFAVAGQGLFRLPAAGGSATNLAGSGDTASRFPWFLPDGRHFLYTGRDRGDFAIYVADLNYKDRKLVVAAGSNAIYTPPSYLLFVREQTLMAQAFDARKLRTTGEAVPIAEQIDNAATGFYVQSQFSASENGELAYLSGGAGTNLQLTWFDRSGKMLGTLGAPGTVSWGAISPDGKTVAVDRFDPQTHDYDIWLYDLLRNST